MALKPMSKSPLLILGCFKEYEFTHFILRKPSVAGINIIPH